MGCKQTFVFLSNYLGVAKPVCLPVSISVCLGRSRCAILVLRNRICTQHIVTPRIASNNALGCLILTPMYSNRQADEQTNKQTERQTHSQTHKETHKQTDKRTNGRTERQAGSQTDGQTDRQTDTRTEKRTDTTSHMLTPVSIRHHLERFPRQTD